MVPASPYRLSLEEALKLAAEGQCREDSQPSRASGGRSASYPKASRWRHPTATVFKGLA